jgi:hypothetical protein
MRGLVAKRVALIVVAISAVAGCTSQSKAPAWPDPSSAQAGDSTPSVCGRIRTAITSDMKPIGASLGTLVGYVTADDDSGQATATEQVQQQIKDLGADIAKAANGASDSKLKSAVASAVSKLNSLAADPSFLSGVTDVSSIPEISKKLDDATHPIAAVCS